VSPDFQQLIAEYWNARPSDDEIRELDPCASPQLAGQNIKLLAASGCRAWLLKLCRNNNGNVPETCRREALTSLFGTLLDVPVVDAWVVPISLLAKYTPRQNPDKDLILDEFVLMPLLANGKSLEQNPCAGAARIGMQIEKVADVFAFMHWIGDEDRSLSDVMCEGDRIYLIDNGLCGPRPGPTKKLRGYHPTPEVYNERSITLKCYGSKPSFVEFVLKKLELADNLLLDPGALHTIAALPDIVIQKVVASVGVDEDVARTLIQRKATIIEDYKAWFAEAVKICR